MKLTDLSSQGYQLWRSYIASEILCSNLFKWLSIQKHWKHCLQISLSYLQSRKQWIALFVFSRISVATRDTDIYVYWLAHACKHTRKCFFPSNSRISVVKKQYHVLSKQCSCNQSGKCLTFPHMFPRMDQIWQELQQYCNNIFTKFDNIEKIL